MTLPKHIILFEEQLPKESAFERVGESIRETGLVGKQIGGLTVAADGNTAQNDGTATDEHLAILRSLIKQQVRDQFQLQLIDTDNDAY